MSFVRTTLEQAGDFVLRASVIPGMNSIILCMRKGCDILNEPSLLWSICIPRYSSIDPSSVSLYFRFSSSEKICSASCFVLEMITQSSTYKMMMLLFLIKIHGSLEVGLKPMSINPWLRCSNQVRPASLSPYRFLSNFKTNCPLLSLRTTPAGGLRNIGYFTFACGYAWTKSTDFVWKLCSIDFHSS